MCGRFFISPVTIYLLIIPSRSDSVIQLIAEHTIIIVLVELHGQAQLVQRSAEVVPHCHAEGEALTG